MILKEKTINKHNFNPEVKEGNTLKVCYMKCDICQKEYEKQLYLVLRGRKYMPLDSCGNKNCTKEKTKKVNFYRFGVESSNQLKSVKQKKKDTCIKNFGVDNPAKSMAVKEKMKNTCLEKYGTEHPHQNFFVRQKYKETMMDRHNVNSSVELERSKTALKEKLRNDKENILKKRKKTMLEKYGVDNVSKLHSFQIKRKQTNIKKYGINYPFHLEEIKEKIYKDKRLSENEIKQICNVKNYKPLFDYSEYQTKTILLPFLCLKHNHRFMSKLSYIKTIFNQCPKCRNYNSSQQENEIADFLDENNIKYIRHDRSIIRTELDFYIPNKNIAIEFNGLYWHCELNKNKTYHYDKFIECKEKRTKLLQIYEDEWRDKKDICKSILRNNFNIIYNNLNARELFLNDNPKIENVKEFLNNNHLQGYCRFNKAFTLIDNNKNIKFCIVFRKPFIKINYKTLEIGRIASENNAIVRGGFSKIMKHAIEWAKSEGYEKILTYSDCRYSWGNVYEKYGFDFCGHTSVGYDYTDWKNRYGRFRFRAREGQSQIEVAAENNVYKIFGAGNYRWILEL